MVQQRGVYHPNTPAPASQGSHALLLLVMMLVATVPVIAVAEPSPPGKANRVRVIATDTLHLRDCPSLTCRIVGSAELGAELEVTGQPVDGFLPVHRDGTDGWAYALFLTHQSDRFPVEKGVPGCDRVALVFNAGMGEQPSESILTTLSDTQVPVTVFAMDWWAESYQDYLIRLDRDTRAVIGSHGDTRVSLTNADDAQVVTEVRNSASRVEQVLGYPVARYYTAYASDTDARVDRIIAEEGYLPISWTISAGDHHSDNSAEEVRTKVLDSVTDGAIVELQLEGPATEGSIAAALPGIIRVLESRGYTLVTIPEIVLPCPPAP
ncbi:MAG: polysaccharide deacetylase family protein [Chloroflexota bacterium]|nr:polysaccharide deacetylase family protein [Chloroflexota bacterium]